jgi:hypothetical protein
MGFVVSVPLKPAPAAEAARARAFAPVAWTLASATVCGLAAGGSGGGGGTAGTDGAEKRPMCRSSEKREPGAKAKDDAAYRDDIGDRIARGRRPGGVDDLEHVAEVDDAGGSERESPRCDVSGNEAGDEATGQIKR